MINYSGFKPRIFPILGIGDDAEIDRAQAIDLTETLNREEVNEIGNPDVLGYLKKSPTIGYRLTQYESGSIEFYQKLVNTTVKGNVAEDAIDLDDFKTSYFDIVAYLTDDDGTFRGTKHYPSLRTAGFSLNIGEPDGVIERSFDFVGESAITWQEDNKYFIYKKHTAGSGADNEIDLSAKAPAEDPDETGVYMLRVIRVRSGVSTELTLTTDYTYSDGTKILTIVSVLTDDVIKAYYTSATAPDTQFTPNTADKAGILGDSIDIYLYIPASGKPSSSDYLYRLQSVGFEIAFEREDQKELGNKDVVLRGIADKSVTITLGRFLEDFSLEEVLRGAGAGYGKIDIQKLSDQVAIIIKVYDDNTKANFKYGIKATGLTPSELSPGSTVKEYVRKDATLIGKNLIITADSSVLGI